MCERWVGNGDRLLFDPSSSLTIAALHSHLGWVVGHWGLKALCLALALTIASCPQLASTPTDSSRLCPGYIFVWRSPASAAPPLIYTGASLDWRLGRGSICYTKSFESIYFLLLSPTTTYIYIYMLYDQWTQSVLLVTTTHDDSDAYNSHLTVVFFS